VWNLALEQVNAWRPGRQRGPGSSERFRQLAEARRDSWLGEGSSSVQQQALRDFDQAMRNWWAGTHRRPRWRRQGVDACGHVAAGNRPTQAVFACVACGHGEHADINAAKNIRARGLRVPARGGRPEVGAPSETRTTRREAA
jgi:hypothetical protein